MIKSVMNWSAKSKTMIGGSMLGGGSVIGIIFGLLASMDSKIEASDHIMKEYVDLKNKTVETRVDGVENGQKDIKTLLNKIDNRLYEMQQQLKK